MATTYIYQSGHRSVDYTPDSDVSAGDVVVQNDLVGVAVNDIAANEKGSLVIDAVIKAPKTAGTSSAIEAGKIVYWDSGNSVVTETAGANYPLGLTVEAATDAASWAYVQMVPTLAAVT
jgi:predicted RecA/RadA family phage recombinase